ncbi:MAG: iron chelate uptake ABC transporter family permease subunit [Gammaproteobacteria bacterium]|jgi:iron complex transport system permease protein|nr:iron chelate uptake ABC transporter family permease subunit [Gammaproteobacteria bacterium]
MPKVLNIPKPEPAQRLLIAGLIVLAISVLFLTWQVKGNWDFVLPYRGKKLFTLIIVGCTVPVATLVFQTLTHNRILTPGIMGFGALYVLIQSSLLFTLGIVGFSQLNTYIKWSIETGLMVVCVLLIYRSLFRGSSHSLYLVVLAGIIMGVLFTSANQLMMRWLDPTEFTVLQDAMYATFGTVKTPLLLISWLVLGTCCLFLWRTHNHLDVFLLGREQCLSLGLDYSRYSKLWLLLSTLLISLTTSLVGPMTFFGLLVVHLTYLFAGNYKHRFLIPMTALLGMFTLVSGEFLLQHVWQFNTRLSIIIELLGGLLFLFLITRKQRP